MKIQTETTLKDIIAFNLYHSDHSPSTMRMEKRIRYAFLGLALLLVLPALIYILLGNILSFVGCMLGIITLFAFSASQAKFRRYITARQVKDLYGEGRNQGTLGHHEIIFRDDGISDESDSGEQFVKWQAVEKTIKTEKYIFVYVSSVSAHLIPRRIFHSDAAYDELYDLILQKKERGRSESV
jgi:YcxB-like protein